MKKLLFVILLFLFMVSTPALCSEEWRKATGEDTPLGTEDINDLDDVLFERVVSPLDRALAENIRGATLVYNSGATINISAGSVVCSNTAGTVRKMRHNTSTVSATFAGNLDVGAEAGSTTYYAYGNCDADATTFTVKISASSTSPTGVTSYIKLGSFYNDASSDIDKTKIFTVPYGNVRADSTGRGLVMDIRSYGTSYSSYTSKVGADLKIAYGYARNIAGSSTQAVTNLPFSSATTYSCVCGGFGTQSAAVASPTISSQDSGSQMTIRNNHTDAVGNNGDCNWTCEGY